MENKDLVTILDNLVSSLQQSGSLEQIYLDSLQEMDYSGAVRPGVSVNQLRSSEGRLPRFLQQSGIRSMMLNDTGNIDEKLAIVSAMALEIEGGPRMERSA